MKTLMTIQYVNEDSLKVNRQKPTANLVLVALPCIKELPSDPEREAQELKITKHNNRKLPIFEE